MARNKSQIGLRLSPEAIRLVKLAAKKSRLTQTAVVEICIAKHSLAIPGLTQKARESLMELIAKELGDNNGKQKPS